VGNSGKQGTSCNDGCHNGGVVPLVRFEGPQRLEVGTLATFRFVVESQSSRQLLAGFNIAASDGLLSVVDGENEHDEVGELTHNFPSSSIDGVAAWQFGWRAPENPGVQTLFGAGLSANGSGGNNGDQSATTTYLVSVTPRAQPGDANCDTRLSAADVAAILALLPTGTAGECGLADADCNGNVEASDLDALSAALFDPLRETGCVDQP